MDKLLKYCLKFFILICFFHSCGQPYDYYVKDFAQEENKKIAEDLTNGIGNYYQGSVPNMFQLYEAAKFDSQSAQITREIGVPYLKRGFPAEFYKFYAESANIDPENWQGWRGYLYLYFYRDYERALLDFDATDIHTPDFVDYPQSLSVDYMRAICYYYLDQPKKAISYIEKHIALETETVGREYIDSKSYILLGLAHEKLENLDEAKKIYSEALKYDSNVASILFHLAEINFKLNKHEQALIYLGQAQKSLDQGIVYFRNYVNEFFKLYQEDIDRLQAKIKGE